ncbi:MAG: tetratricopeptide repeat protein, partial [Acidobacteriota bacterium]
MKLGSVRHTLMSDRLWHHGKLWRVSSRLALLLSLLLASGIAATPDDGGSLSEISLAPLPPPNLEHLEDAVAAQLTETLDLLRAIRTDPSTNRAQLAEAFGVSGRLFQAYEIDEQAAICFANAVRLAPADFRWVYHQAVLAHSSGRLEEALAGYQRALEIDPRHLAATVHLGDVYLAVHRLAEARSTLDRALELDPGSAAALASLGQVALSEKDFAAAAKVLEAALAATPDADRLHHPLGLAYRGLGEMDKARHHLALRGKVGVRPPDPLIDSLADLKVGERVFLLRGQLAFRSGRYPEAVEAFQAALEARPESVRARVNLASALAQAGRRAEAIDHFRQALQLDPDNRTALFNLGALQTQAGDHAAAAESYAAALALDPQDVEASLELARAEVRLGRLESATRHAMQTVELDPASEPARLLEVQLLVQQERFVEAGQRLDAAQRAMPDAGRLSAAYAKFLAACPDLEQRDGPRAFDLALRVFRATGHAGHAELVALALAEAGRCDEAEVWQSRAVEAARQAGAEQQERAFGATLAQLKKRPCR